MCARKQTSTQLRTEQNGTNISVIVPAYNEAVVISGLLETLAPLRQRGHEVIVVDGASDDATVATATPWADVVLAAPRGRARQMNAGARVAKGDVLWFLHADSNIPQHADALIRAALDRGAMWGWFDVRLSGAHLGLRVVEWMMNRRARLSRIATGDQGLFVTRALFASLDGFADIDLMEDVELTARLRRQARPVALRVPLVTSSRRWERDGILQTIVFMWWLRLAYAFGAHPSRLAKRYR